MARDIINHSNENSFALLNKDKLISKAKSGKKEGIPDPENMSLEFLIPYKQFVEKLIKPKEVALSTVTRDNMYPVINKEKGASVGMEYAKLDWGG